MLKSYRFWRVVWQYMRRTLDTQRTQVMLKSEEKTKTKKYLSIEVDLFLFKLLFFFCCLSKDGYASESATRSLQPGHLKNQLNDRDTVSAIIRQDTFPK